MPVYTVTAPNGKTLDITGPMPPTKEDLDRIFAEAGVGGKPVIPPRPDEPKMPRQRTYVDNAVDLIPPAMATAGGILGAIPGTAFGFGVGGLYTGAAGAALGGAGGEGIKHAINAYRGSKDDYADAGVLDTIPKTEGGMAKDLGVTGTEYGVADLAGAYILSNLAKGGVGAAKWVASKLPPGGLAAASKATSAVLKATGIGHLGTMLEGATDLLVMANGGDTTGAIATARAAAATARAQAAAATAAQKVAAVQAQEAALNPARRANVDVWVKNGMSREKAIAREWDAHIKDLGATLNKAAQPTVTPPTGPGPGIGNAQPLPKPPTRQVVVTPSVQPQPAGAGPAGAAKIVLTAEDMVKAQAIAQRDGKPLSEAIRDVVNAKVSAPGGVKPPPPVIDPAAQALRDQTARAAAQPPPPPSPEPLETDLLGSNTQQLPNQPPPPANVPPPPVRLQPADASPAAASGLPGPQNVKFTTADVARVEDLSKTMPRGQAVATVYNELLAKQRAGSAANPIRVDFTGPNVVGGPAGAPAPAAGAPAAAPPPVAAPPVVKPPPATPESNVVGNNMGDALGLPPAAAAAPAAPPAPATAPAPAATTAEGDLFAEARDAFQKAGVTPRGADLGLAVQLMKNDRPAWEAVQVIAKMRTAGGAVSTVDPAAAANMASRLGLPSDAEMTADMAGRATKAARPNGAPAPAGAPAAPPPAAPAGEPAAAPPLASPVVHLTEKEIQVAKTAAAGMPTSHLEDIAFDIADPEERAIYMRELASRTDRGGAPAGPTPLPTVAKPAKPKLVPKKTATAEIPDLTPEEIADIKARAKQTLTVNLEHKASAAQDPVERAIYAEELATRTDREPGAMAADAKPKAPTVKRAADFKESGNYDVLVVGADKVHKFTIFRDTDQFSHPLWHAEGPTLTREVTGLSKADVLKNLDRFVGNQ